MTIKISDEATTEAVRDAVVYLKGPKNENQPASMGTAIFSSLNSGTYTITVKAEGYSDKTANLTLDASKKKDYAGTFKLVKAVSTVKKTTSAKVTVRLIDSETEAVVKNAVVEITAKQKQKKETSSGEAVFEKVENGPCSIDISADGYELKNGKIEIDTQKKTEYIVKARMIKRQPAKKEEPAPLKVAQEEKKPLGSQTPLPALAEDSALKNPLNVTNPLPENDTETPISSPVNATVMKAIFIFLCLIVFVLILMLKWSKMTVAVKLLIGGAAMACACISSVLFFYQSNKTQDDVPASTILTFKPSALSEALPPTIQKGPEALVPEKKTAVQNPPKNSKAAAAPAQTQTPKTEIVPLEDAATKHELGSMLFMRGVTENKQEDKEKGLALLEEAFRSEPDNAIYIFDLADAYVKMNTLLYMKLATDLYRGLLETAPENDKLLARTADAYARMYQYDKAFQYAARRAWSGAASPVMAASQIALISLVSRDLDRGIAEVSLIIQGGPLETPELKIILAGLYAENGMKEKAAGLLDSVIKELPARSELAQRAHAVKGEIVR